MRWCMANIIRWILVVAAAGGVYVSLAGCESSRTRSDPYVLMLNNYIAGLDNWDYKSGEKPSEPREPTFLSCGDVMGGRGGGVDINRRLGGIHGTRDSFLREQVLSSVARCEEINNQRQAAYNEAMKKYESVIKAQTEKKEEKAGNR
jgi:hypothetical protein